MILILYMLDFENREPTEFQYNWYICDLFREIH